MLRLCTRRTVLAVRTLPRVALPVARTLVPVVSSSFQRHYTPTPAVFARPAVKELRPVEEDNKDQEEDEEYDEYNSFQTPPEVYEKILAHAKTHWTGLAPKTLPPGWSNDWANWEHITSLFAPSPFYLMLPQLCMFLLRCGVKSWAGLSPYIDASVPPNVGVVAYKDELVIFRIGDASYIIDLASGDAGLYTVALGSDGGFTQGQAIGENAHGRSLCDRLMGRDDSVREALFKEGYLPYVPEATTEAQEEETIVVTEEMEEKMEEMQEQLKMIDSVMRDLGLEPPENPEEWQKFAEKHSDAIADRLEQMQEEQAAAGPKGDQPTVQELQEEIQRLKKQVDELSKK